LGFGRKRATAKADPYGMTTKKQATTTTKNKQRQKADPYGMTTKKQATTTAKRQATTTTKTSNGNN